MQPSDPRDPALWGDIAEPLAANRALRASMLDAPLGYDDDAAALLVIDAESAALESLDAREASSVAPDLREAAAFGVAATLCAAQRAGAVDVELADGRARAFPAGGRAGMSAPRWQLAAALASVCEDAQALRILTDPANLAACQEAPEVADDFWTPVCVALAAFYLDEGSAAELLAAALAAAAPARLRIATPQFVRDTQAPVVELALQVARRDAAAVESALVRALDAHARYYGAGDGRGERLGLLAFGIGGVVAAAVRRGLVKRERIDAEPLLAPLLRGAAAPPQPLVFRFEPMRILHDMEAHWFLDLRGFPREGRTHQIVHDRDVLQARYRALGARGLPLSEARFALDTADASLPLALDAGELVHRYGELRSTALAQREASRRAALLDEAGAVLDAIEMRFASGSERIDPKAVASVLGRQVAVAAPEAFTRGWLREQREWIAQMKREPAAAAPGDPREAALAMAETVKAAVQPLLEALAHDADGAVAATLKPRPGDYALAFVPDTVERARAAYEAIWATAPRVNRAMSGSRIESHVAPAGMLATDNELSRHFPGGYRAIAHRLDPHRVWVRWKVVQPGETAGTSYDGLVWLDDHWAWFPKPYRALAK